MNRTQISRFTALVTMGAAIVVSSFPTPTACWGAEATTERGVLKGRFLFDGKRPEPRPIDVSKEPLCKPNNLVDERLLVDVEGGLKNVVVYVVTEGVAPPGQAKPPAGKKTPATKDDKDIVVLKMKNCLFEPRILPMLVTQTLVIENEDEAAHSAWVSELGQAGVSPSSPTGIKQHKYAKTSRHPLPVECNIHPWMKAYILPRDNPYFAVSGDDGSFAIKELPVGKPLEFQVWHEAAGNFKSLDRQDWNTGRFSLEIKAGENDLGEIKLDAKAFERTKN